MDTMNAEECAKLLHCTTERIEELARQGEIPGLKVGRAWVLFKLDLLDFLADKARDDAEKRRGAAQSPAASRGRRHRAPPKLPTMPSSSGRQEDWGLNSNARLGRS